MSTEIKLCPKGTRPYEIDKRCGGIVMRNVVLKCNCGCCRVSVMYHDSKPSAKKAKEQAIAEWNEAVANCAGEQLRKEADA